MIAKASAPVSHVAIPERWTSVGRLICGLTVGACLLVVLRPAEAQVLALTKPTQPVTEPPPKEGPSAADIAKLAVVAHVNQEEISRQILADEALLHYGPEVLEILANKELIEQECQRRGVTITAAEVSQEIQRMAQRFGLPVDQWHKMIKQERGIKPEQYAGDIIWPLIALRKLAGGRIEVTQEELAAEYEKDYGPAVQARIIVATSPQEAESLQQAAAKNPEDFANLAKNRSKDPNSASAKGLIPPIRRHVGRPEIEQTAFSMRDGDISPVIPIGNQFVILKRERLIVAQREIPFDDVKGRLEEILRERKMHAVGRDVATALKNSAQIENYLDSGRQPPLPGVVATVNGHAINQHDLAEACIERHGEDVLEGTINRRLIEQACKRAGVTVSEQEIDQEIARVAGENLKLKADQTPDVEGWLKLVPRKLRISVEVYRRDSIWPAVALRKLVADKVLVDEEDVRKGFEANYGPRVCCRAIVLSDVRLAQKVWEKARNRPTIENFGDLAAEYSIESGSRALRGEVPPIRKNGGRPLLEKEAFSLKPGELSGIVQVDGDRFVILLCEKYTDPVVVDPNSVREMLREDIFAKKLQLAMGQKFDEIKDNATIDNFLTGTSHTPRKAIEKALVAPIEASKFTLPPK